MKQHRIVFMGTPAFAVPALETLLKTQTVVGVYSQPPRPAKRGQKVQKSPIHQVAEQHGVPVFNPEKLTPEATEELKALKPDIICVAAYGLLLPQRVLDVAPCLNIHPSQLPRWRGAAPIQHTVLAGDSMTDMCIMHMEKGLDTGPVYLRVPYPVLPNDTSGDLHDRMAIAGAQHLLEVLNAWPNIQAKPQVDEGTTYAHKITPEMRPTDWNKPALEVHNHIRGLAPWPGATCTHGDTTLKLLRSSLLTSSGQLGNAGEILSADGDGIVIACGTGSINITELQRPGKKAMPVAEFLKGYPLQKGDILS